MKIKKFSKIDESVIFDEKFKVEDFYVGIIEHDEYDEYVLVAKTKNGDIVFGNGEHINFFDHE